MRKILLATCLLLAPVAARADSDALWKIISGNCLPAAASGGTGQCAAVDLAGGDVVLKDTTGNTQFLLMPAAKITGIEDPAVLAPDAPNFFAEAWAARHFFEQRAHHAVPRDVVMLAINSVRQRSQNQLHIHIDCVRLDVRAALLKSPPGTGWTPIRLAGELYQARTLPGPDLQDNPFRLVAAELDGARADMKDQTLAVIGADLPAGPGFILLAQSPGGSGHAEELQDHGCAVLGE